MSYKTKILDIYPDAIVIKDIHNYGSYVGNNKMYMILHKIPNFNDGMLITDFTQLSNVKIRPLSGWYNTEQDAWMGAWNNYQELLIKKLEN